MTTDEYIVQRSPGLISHEQAGVILTHSDTSEELRQIIYRDRWPYTWGVLEHLGVGAPWGKAVRVWGTDNKTYIVPENIQLPLDRWQTKRTE